MRRWIGFALVGLALPLGAGEPPEGIDGELATGARPASARALEVRLLQGGALGVRQGEEWNEATLVTLAAALDVAVKADAAEREKIGSSGYEKVPGGGTVSRLFFSLRADPLVPWQHVQWLLTLAAKRKVYRIELRLDGRGVVVYLPRDRGVVTPAKESPKRIKAAIHVVSKRETPIQWGDHRVNHPSVVKYRYGDQESSGLADVLRWFRQAKKAATEQNAELRGEIKAGHKVPFARIFEVIQLYADAGYEHLDFHGTQIPGAELRRVPRLPYPKHNYAVD